MILLPFQSANNVSNAYRSAFLDSIHSGAKEMMTQVTMSVSEDKNADRVKVQPAPIAVRTSFIQLRKALVNILFSREAKQC